MDAAKAPQGLHALRTGAQWTGRVQGRTDLDVAVTLETVSAPEEACVKLQSAARARAARDLVARLRRGMPEDETPDSFAVESAVMVQSVARSWLVRRRGMQNTNRWNTLTWH